MELEKDVRSVVADKGYIKLIKNTKNYNWEIKGYEDLDVAVMKELIKKLNELNSELVKLYGNE